MTGDVTWAEARRSGALPTNVSLTAAEQLQRCRDLLAHWDDVVDPAGPEAWCVSALADALGVRPFAPLREGVRAAEAAYVDESAAQPLLPGDVPCEHGHPDGVCTICHDAPMLPYTQPALTAMPPLPTLPAVRLALNANLRTVLADLRDAGHQPRLAVALEQAYARLTTAERRVLNTHTTTPTEESEYDRDR